MKTNISLALILITIITWTFSFEVQQSFASSVPMKFSYSGTMVDDSNQPITIPYVFRFSLWSTSDLLDTDISSNGSLNTSAENYGGWNEVKTIQPNNEGSFLTEVGDTTPLPSLNSSTHGYLQVEVKPVNDSDTEFILLDPDLDITTTVDRNPLNSTPYAINADMIDNADIGVNEGNIAILGPNGKWDTSLIPSTITDTSLTIDSDNTTTDITLSFGTTLDKSLMWDASEAHFVLNDGLLIQDNLSVSGNLLVDGKINGRDTTTDSTELDRLTGISHNANQDTSTNSDTFTLDSDDSATDVTLTFGTTLNKSLMWDYSESHFVFNDGVLIQDNLSVQGNILANGTVDGRDIATDGTKLDTIEINASADQTAAEVSFVDPSVASNQNIPNDATALWKLDNNADDTGNTYDGTATNGVTFASGQRGQAAQFDNSDRIYVSQSNDFSFGRNDFTILAWVNFSNEPTSYRNIISTFKRGWILSTDDAGDMGFYDSGKWQKTSVNVPTGWHFWTIVRSGTDLLFYLDGILQETISSFNRNVRGNDELQMGKNDEWTRYFQEYSLDDVAIYNRALSSTEVSDEYTNGSGSISGSPTTIPLNSTNVQDAIMELKGLIDDL